MDIIWKTQNSVFVEKTIVCEDVILINFKKCNFNVT